MPEIKKKKPRKPRARGPAAKKSKKGLKQKQKQKQQVTVNVSAGGSGGGGYIPIPQSPAVDYGLISQLLRPANTVDVPIRAAVLTPEPVFVKPAEVPNLASEVKAKRKYTRKVKVPVEGFVSGTEPDIKSGMEKGFAMGRQDPFVGGNSNFSRPEPSMFPSDTESAMSTTAKKVRKPRAKKAEPDTTYDLTSSGPYNKTQQDLLLKYAPEPAAFMIDKKK